jgi:hypothetical protein
MVKQLCIAFVDMMLKKGDINIYIYIYIYICACAVYEVFECMAYYGIGISSNLILYLTKKLHQGTVTASNNVTDWVGTVWITPISGAYVPDAHHDRYWTFVIDCIIYISVRLNHYYLISHPPIFQLYSSLNISFLSHNTIDIYIRSVVRPKP